MRWSPLVLAVALCCAAPSDAATLDAFSEKEVAAALRSALEKGATDAVLQLGKKDGFLADPKVKVPLPRAIAKHEKTLRKLGLGKQVDGLVTAMNRAAETAVPEAKALVVGAVKSMSVADAKTILSGPDDAATQYFQKRTREPLSVKLLPIVKQATAKADVAKAYASLAGKAAKYGLIPAADADLDAFVTGKALDGLYSKIAESERAIRKDPLKATSSLLRSVFGALKP